MSDIGDGSGERCFQRIPGNRHDGELTATTTTARRTFAFGIAFVLRAKSSYAVDLTCAVLYGMLMEINALRFLIVR